MADTPHTNLAFTRAAFAFKDGLDKARESKNNNQVKVSVEPVETPSVEPPNARLSSTDEAAHQARHQRRIHIARVVQHLLTSVLSIVIAILQGKVFVLYKQTQNVAGAWPMNPDLVPTLMLFVTAVIALTIDACALIAYFWPKSSIGKRAYSVRPASAFIDWHRLTHH